jgi:hypothetical protein
VSDPTDRPGAGQPHDAILAVEPGSYTLEKQRHRQFAAAHAYREWFHPTPELLTHVQALRELHGDPHDFIRRHYADRRKRTIARLGPAVAARVEQRDEQRSIGK